jgi:predicted RNA-binding Zn-ribbon protein involved in translation (DUF1610 family)
MNDTFPPPGYVLTQSAIEGIEVYMPAPPDFDSQQEIVEFKCPQCGAVTAFSTADDGLTCTYCGFYEAPQKEVVGTKASRLEFTPEALKQTPRLDEVKAGISPGVGLPPGVDTSQISSEKIEQRKEMACQSCGALTSIPANNLSHTCPFCGSNQVTHRQAPQDLLQPRFLIPFKLVSTDCTEIIERWLISSWMTPSSLRKLANMAAFQAMYLPFWTFHAVNLADWKAEAGHPKTERYYENGEWKERIVIEWRWESGNIRLNIDDLLVSGTIRLSERILSQIKDFDLSALAPYEPKYLAGFQAQAYDIPLEEAWDAGRNEMREQTRHACLNQTSTPMVRNFSMNLDFSDESWRYVLLPIYLAAYKYNNRSYQVMINGQTGKIAGQRPADWDKIWLVIAILLAPGIISGLIGLITIPIGGVGVVIGVLGFVVLLIGLVFGFVIYNQAQALDDI